MAAQKSTPETHPDAFPVASLARDGWSTDTQATATCFCGSVQMVVPTTAPGLSSTFTCHCPDCHKITASMYASNFVVLDTHTSFVRGEANLTSFAQRDTIANGNLMTNYFCKTCGTLMYRVGEGFPGSKIARIGTVDDWRVQEGMKPGVEFFVGERVGWVGGVKGVKGVSGMGK